MQGTYETFAEAGRQHYDGNLKGKWILTGGLGGMGGAQPLAAVMAGACCLAVECDETRIDFRLRTRYVDEKAKTHLDEALDMIERWTKAGEAKSVGFWAMRPMCSRNWWRAGAGPTWSPTRPLPMIRSTATCRRAGPWLSGATSAKAIPAGGRKGGARLHESACRGHGRFLECRRADARLRQQYPPGGQGRGS